MYVWRIPLFFFATLVTGAVTLFGVAIVLALRIRRVALAAIIVLASPLLASAIVEPQLALAARSGLYIDPSPMFYFLPAAACCCLPSQLCSSRAMAQCEVVPGSSPSCLATLNSINWCSPGWCARFGFPFPDSWWSDSILIIDGENVTAGFSKTAVVLNIAVAGVATAALRWRHRATAKRASF